MDVARRMCANRADEVDVNENSKYDTNRRTRTHANSVFRLQFAVNCTNHCTTKFPLQPSPPPPPPLLVSFPLVTVQIAWHRKYLRITTLIFEHLIGVSLWSWKSNMKWHWISNDKNEMRCHDSWVCVCVVCERACEFTGGNGMVLVFAVKYSKAINNNKIQQLIASGLLLPLRFFYFSFYYWYWVRAGIHLTLPLTFGSIFLSLISCMQTSTSSFLLFH